MGMKERYEKKKARRISKGNTSLQYIRHEKEIDPDRHRQDSRMYKIAMDLLKKVEGVSE